LRPRQDRGEASKRRGEAEAALCWLEAALKRGFCLETYVTANKWNKLMRLIAVSSEQLLTIVLLVHNTLP